MVLLQLNGERERGREEGRRGEEGKRERGGGGRVNKGRSKSSVLTCFSWQ